MGLRPLAKLLRTLSIGKHHAKPTTYPSPGKEETDPYAPFARFDPTTFLVSSRYPDPSSPSHRSESSSSSGNSTLSTVVTWPSDVSHEPLCVAEQLSGSLLDISHESARASQLSKDVASSEAISPSSIAELRVHLQELGISVMETGTLSEVDSLADTLLVLLDRASGFRPASQLADNEVENVDGLCLRNPGKDSDSEETVDIQEVDQLILDIVDVIHLLSSQYDLGRYDDLLEEGTGQRLKSLLECIRAERTRAMGDDDRIALNATSTLAILYFDCGKWAQAENEATTILNHLDSTNTWNADFTYFRARLYLVQHRWSDAEPILKEIYQRAGDSGGQYQAYPKGMQRYIEDLLMTYLKLEKWAEAEKLLTTEWSPRALASKWVEQVEVLIGQEKWTEAKRVICREYRNERPHSSNGSPTTHPRYLLARVYLGQERWDRAISKFERNIDWVRWHKSIREDRWNRHDRNTLRNVRGLGQARIGVGQIDEGEQLLSQVVQGSREALGRDDADTLDAMCALACFHVQECRWDDAEPHLIDIIERRKALSEQGPDHPATLRAMETLAKVYVAKKKWGDAVALLEHVLEKRDVWPGEDHPHTFRCVDALSDVYRALERWVEMDRMMRRMLRAR